MWVELVSHNDQIIANDLLAGFAGTVAELRVDVDEEDGAIRVLKKIVLSSDFSLESTSELVTLDKNRLPRRFDGRLSRLVSSLLQRGYRLVVGVRQVRPGRLPVVLKTGRMAV